MRARATRGRHRVRQLRGTFIAPAAGKTILRLWRQDWLDSIDVAACTEDFYRSLLRRQILPRWCDHGLTDDLSGVKAKRRPGRKSRGPGVTRQPRNTLSTSVAQASSTTPIKPDVTPRLITQGRGDERVP